MTNLETYKSSIEHIKQPQKLSIWNENFVFKNSDGPPEQRNQSNSQKRSWLDRLLPLMINSIKAGTWDIYMAIQIYYASWI